ncbi:MAG: (2Fe-2S)-binding protein [Deltaproteobacteria bacterium]|nr:(2Fe-2S)-binding protein [Deltaproteobacteria bacterium]
MSTISFTIDGKKVEGSPGELVIEVARRYCIEIPSLCHNEALKPFGYCRVCVVEITRDGRSRITPSCTSRIEEGMEVVTTSEKILQQRRGRLELMLARAPEAPRIQKMAAEMGVTPPPPDKEADNCILCGLCVRTCKEVVGVNALSFQKRGDTRVVGLLLHDGSTTCIGCGTCAYICPTGVIEMKDDGNSRIIWNNKFVLRACKSCGVSWIPEEQIKHICEISTTPPEYFDYCPDCRP